MNLTNANLNSSKTKVMAWLSIVVCWTFYLFGCLARVEPGILVHDLMHDFGFDASHVGFIVSVMYWSYDAMQIPWGILLDKWGYKAVITSCCFICALGVLIFGIASDALQLMIGRFLVGFAASSAFLSCGKVASELFGKNKFPIFTGIATCMGCLGAICGSSVCSFLVKGFGWRTATVGIAVFGFLLGIVAWMAIKPQINQNSIKTNISPWTGIKQLSLNYNVWLIGFYGAMSYLPVSAIADLWGVSFIQKRFAIPLEQAAILPSLIYIGFGLGSVASAVWAEKWRSYKKTIVLFTVFLIISLYFAIYSDSIDFTICVSLFCLASFFAGADTLTFAMCYSYVPKEYAGISSGFNNMILMMGGLFFEPQLGRLLDLFRNGKVNPNGSPLYDLLMYRQAFIWIIIGIALSLIAILFIKDNKEMSEGN